MSEKRLLYVSNISEKRMSYSFSGSAVNAAAELGMEFIYVANRSLSTAEDIRLDEEKYGVRLLNIDLSRNPFSLKNIKAYRQLVDIIRKYDIEYMHCNTPVGGMLGRLAAKSCGVKRVLYQAHGFHFYKGAPLINRILYGGAERLLAHITDAIITINKEDYSAAQKMHLRNGGNAYYVHGVGLETKSVENSLELRAKKRRELGLNDSDIMLISAGDLIKRKNYETAIKAIALAGDKRLKYYICGDGPLLERLKGLARNRGVEDSVIFLGRREDVKSLLAAADAFLFTSKQEGLARSLMEAMTASIPCIVSSIRGNTDLVENGKNGFLCPPCDALAFANAIKSVADNTKLRKEMGQANGEIIKNFDITVASAELAEIYRKEFTGAVE